MRRVGTVLGMPLFESNLVPPGVAYFIPDPPPGLTNEEAHRVRVERAYSLLREDHYGQDIDGTDLPGSQGPA